MVSSLNPNPAEWQAGRGSVTGSSQGSCVRLAHLKYSLFYMILNEKSVNLLIH